MQRAASRNLNPGRRRVMARVMARWWLALLPPPPTITSLPCCPTPSLPFPSPPFPLPWCTAPLFPYPYLFPPSRPNPAPCCPTHSLFLFVPPLPPPLPLRPPPRVQLYALAEGLGSLLKLLLGEQAVAPLLLLRSLSLLQLQGGRKQERGRRLSCSREVRAGAAHIWCAYMPQPRTSIGSAGTIPPTHSVAAQALKGQRFCCCCYAPRPNAASCCPPHPPMHTLPACMSLQQAHNACFPHRIRYTHHLAAPPGSGPPRRTAHPCTQLTPEARC